MPVFELCCTACGHGFERLVFNQSATVSCPRCGAGELVKRPSAFGTSGLERNVSTAAGPSCSGCSKASCSGCH